MELALRPAAAAAVAPDLAAPPAAAAAPVPAPAPAVVIVPGRAPSLVRRAAHVMEAWKRMRMRERELSYVSST
jgi:hypothetical protein